MLKVSSYNVHDLIFVEEVGKCQFPVSRALHGYKFDPWLGGFLRSFHPTLIGMLIPRSGEDFSNRSLNMLLLDLTMKIIKDLANTCLTSSLL